MPNGYDWLIAEIQAASKLLEYCESLLRPQLMIADFWGDFKDVKPELAKRMINLLDETEGVHKLIEQGFHEKIKPGIIEHNKCKVKASEALEEISIRDGVPAAEAKLRKEQLASSKWSYDAMEAQLISLRENMTRLRERMKDHTRKG